MEWSGVETRRGVRSWRSLRELFALILAVAGVSVTVTYHISRHLISPPPDSAALSIHLDGQLRIYRDRRGLEGLDIEPPDSAMLATGSVTSRTETVERSLRQMKDFPFGNSTHRPQIVLLCVPPNISESVLYIHNRIFENTQVQIKLAFTNSSMCTAEVMQYSWSVLLCMACPESITQSYCHNKKCDTSFPFQRIGIIPQLHTAFKNKESLCTISSLSQYEQAVRATCYVLPRQYDAFMSQLDRSGRTEVWVMKPLLPGDKLHTINPQRNMDLDKIEKMNSESVLLQRHHSSPLLLFGMPFNIIVYVLITSTSPLRAYMHEHGYVQFRYDYQQNFKKIAGRVWTLEKLWIHLSESYSDTAISTAKTDILSILAKTLIASSTSEENWPGSFQLIAFEVIFNTTLHPLLVDVDLSPNVFFPGQRLETTSSIVLADTIHILLGSTPKDLIRAVTKDVSRALHELRNDIEIYPDCHHNEKLCLNEQDISFIIDSRKESLKRGSYLQLYPSSNGARYNSIMKTLYNHLDSSTSNQHYNMNHTLELHQILTKIENIYSGMQDMQNSYDDAGSSSSQNEIIVHNREDSIIHNIYFNLNATRLSGSKSECSDSSSDKPMLRAIFTQPILDLTPMFDPLVDEYYTSVPYELILIQIWGEASHCDSEARLEDKFGPRYPANYSLGLGTNKIIIKVVDVSHSEPWVLSSYTVVIYREYLGEGRLVSNTKQEHVVCSLKQSCTLRVFAAAPCGLQTTNYSTWTQYRIQKQYMRHCSNGHEPGSWLVPCENNCQNPENCNWTEAVWQPTRCIHPKVDKPELQKCLSGKQVLFIGDSTNRGMMHYVMESVNGSLTEWDKTHNIKVYSSLNNEQTTVSFAYYPQFWLPASQRPVFDKALYQLLRKTMPLENNRNTILVVGGVHWLATHHLNVIDKALKREGLADIHVIIKSLGAGFHQPVDGLHCLTLQEQRKLLIHNARILSLAEKLNYQVVDTFNITMARPKDFLQGKCACHFHTVREILPSFSGVQGGMSIQYHIEGDINKAYSDILINSICKYR